MELTFLQQAEEAERTTAIDESRIISEAALAVFGRKDERYKRVLQLLEAGASLDAAMSLVPEGYGWRLWIPNAGSPEPINVTIWGDGRSYAPRITKAATPALALCAAALRARAETQP